MVSRISWRWVVPTGAAALLAAVVVAAGPLGLADARPTSAGVDPVATLNTPTGTQVVARRTSAGVDQVATLNTPTGTQVVARLPLGLYGTYAWSPDGAYLLVTDGDQYKTRVYDRFGGFVSEFGAIEGWLDSTHLIDGAGYVADVSTSHSGGPTANSRVVANGHGSAAIIVAVPACTGDPIIDWYKNGGYVKAGEKATPFGWSPDGKRLLLGHMSCSGLDAEMYGWKGPVDIVDFAAGKVLATAPDVRGAMAFNPSGTRLAAGSDNDLEILDIATGRVKTVSNARLLGWADDDHVYCLTSGGSLALVGATASLPDWNGIVLYWAIDSTTGASLDIAATGNLVRILGADGKATLLDLGSSGLVVDRDLTFDKVSGQPRGSWLVPAQWSPDGRMLVLKSADGTSLALISVDPAGGQ